MELGARSKASFLQQNTWSFGSVHRPKIAALTKRWMPKQKLCVLAEIPGAKDQDPSQSQDHGDQSGWILVVHPHLPEQPGGPHGANQEGDESHGADAHLGCPRGSHAWGRRYSLVASLWLSGCQAAAVISLHGHKRKTQKVTHNTISLLLLQVFSLYYLYLRTWITGLQHIIRSSSFNS